MTQSNAKKQFLRTITILTITLALAVPITALNTEFADSNDWNQGSYNATTIDNIQNTLTIGNLNGTNEDNLKAYWRLNEDLLDYSGNQLDAINSRNLSYSTGILSNSAAIFNATEETYIEIENDEKLNPEQFTLSTWIKKNSTQQDEQPIIQKSTGDNRGYELMIDNHFSEDRLALYVYSNEDDEQRYRTEETIPDNEWTHVAATLNSQGEPRLYINGENKTIRSDSSETPATIDKDDNNLLIGASSTNTGGDYFDGKIDEVRIFNETLTENEILGESFYPEQENYQGEYNTENIERNNPVNWTNIEINAQVPSETSLDLKINAVDNQDNVIDTQVIQVNDGENTYDLELQDSQSIQFEYQGNTSDIQDTWQVQSTDVNFNYLELDKPEDEDHIIGATADLEYVVETSLPGSVDLIINETVEDQKTVSKGENNFLSEENLESGTYEWQIEFTDDEASTYTSETQEFTYEETEVFVTKFNPSEQERIEGEQEVEFLYEVEAQQDSNIEVYLDDEVVSTETVNEGETTNFTYNEVLRSDRYQWRVEAEYTDKDGEETTYATDTTNFAVVESIILQTEEDWLQGEFNHSMTGSPVTDIIRTGYLTATLGAETNYPSESLTGFWRMNNEDSLTDFSQNNNTGTPTDNLTIDTGLFNGESLKFNESQDDYVEVLDDESLNNQEFTVSAWIYKDFTEEDEVPIIQKSTGDNRGYELLIDYFNNDDDRLALFLYSDQEGAQRYRTMQSIPSNEWTHVAATITENEEVKLYINGNEQPLATDPGTPEMDKDDNELLIGATSTGSPGKVFNGRIDQVMIYNQALTQQEMEGLALFNNAGEYYSSYTSETLEPGIEAEWDRVQINNTRTQATKVNAIFTNLNDDEQEFELQEDNLLKNLDVENSSQAQLTLDGETTNIEESWTIESIKLDYIKRYFDFEAESIEFNRTDIVRGKTVEINTTVKNNEQEETNVDVQFTIQSFGEDGWETIRTENETFETKGNDQETYTYEWTPGIGPFRFNTTVDPEDEIKEVNENNNEEIENIDVSSHNTFYGNISESIKLGDGDNNYRTWENEEPNGNVYVADSDTDFENAELSSLNTSNGLEQADSALSLLGHNDSLQELYDESGDGNPDRTECFTIRGEEDCEVPVIYSSDAETFETGILYDASDSEYDGSQDLIFITEVMKDTDGEFGTYDYESKVPATLPELNEESDSVSIYTELE